MCCNCGVLETAVFQLWEWFLPQCCVSMNAQPSICVCVCVFSPVWALRVEWLHCVLRGHFQSFQVSTPAVRQTVLYPHPSSDSLCYITFSQHCSFIFFHKTFRTPLILEKFTFIASLITFYIPKLGLDGYKLSYLGHLLSSRMRFETCSHLTTWKYKICNKKLQLHMEFDAEFCHSLKMWIVHHSTKIIDLASVLFKFFSQCLSWDYI